MTQWTGCQQMKWVLNPSWSFLIWGWDGQLSADKMRARSPLGWSPEPKASKVKGNSWCLPTSCPRHLILLTLNLSSPFRANDRKNLSGGERAHSHGDFCWRERTCSCPGPAPSHLQQVMASIWGASCSPPSICTQRAFHTNSPSWDAARVPPEHSQCHIHPINESKITISKRVERSSGPVCVTLTGKEDILDMCTWVCTCVCSGPGFPASSL